MLDVSLQGLDVDMIFSHDLLPSAFWAIGVFALGTAFFREWKVGAVGALMFIVHIGADYVSGYPHHVFGPETPQVGIALYPTAPYVSVVIEAIFSGALIWYLFREDKRPGLSRLPSSKWAIIGFFVFNVAFLLSIASNSVSSLFELSQADTPFVPAMPILVLNYWGMLFFLLYFGSKVERTEHGAT